MNPHEYHESPLHRRLDRFTEAKKRFFADFMEARERRIERDKKWLLRQSRAFMARHERCPDAAA